MKSLVHGRPWFDDLHMGNDVYSANGKWPPPPDYWSLTLSDGRAVVEAAIDERGSEMHFTCTECGIRDDFYCDRCAYNFVHRHSFGDHRPEDEVPPPLDAVFPPNS